jgi:hypothetical protein
VLIDGYALAPACHFIGMVFLRTPGRAAAVTLNRDEADAAHATTPKVSSFILISKLVVLRDWLRRTLDNASL